MEFIKSDFQSVIRYMLPGYLAMGILSYIDNGKTLASAANAMGDSWTPLFFLGPIVGYLLFSVHMVYYSVIGYGITFFLVNRCRNWAYLFPPFHKDLRAFQEKYWERRFGSDERRRSIQAGLDEWYNTAIFAYSTFWAFLAAPIFLKLRGNSLSESELWISVGIGFVFLFVAIGTEVMTMKWVMKLDKVESNKTDAP